MNDIQLVDLKNQHKKISTDIKKAIDNVIDSSAFINGPEVKLFASELEDYLGNNVSVIPCANGTDALQIALMALDLKPGDEVITPSFTYIATAEVISLLHLTPVFVEVDEKSFTIDIESVKRMISPKTKAIIAVHLYGQCANIEQVIELANENGLKVIEDTAQALGSEFTTKDGNTHKAGTIADIGTTSFFPSKNLGCMGDGGAIFTKDKNLAQKIKMLANHGQVKKYVHDLIGTNSRLDSLQAAVLRVKLPYLNEYINARQSVADRYNAKLSQLEEIETPYVSNFSNHGYHQYTLKFKNEEVRDSLREHLLENRIPNNIYYPIPIHKQKGLTSEVYKMDNLDLTEDLCKRVLSLPMHTELKEEEINYITDSIKDFFRE